MLWDNAKIGASRVNILSNLITQSCVIKRVIDVDTYIFNLTEANENGEGKSPKYFKLYNHKKDLEMENVFPKDFDELAHRMAVNATLYNRFFRYQKFVLQVSNQFEV